MFDRLKSYGWTAVAIAATTLLAAQTWRLHSAQLDMATTRATHADTLRTIAGLSAKALSAVLARETQWAQAQEKNAHETEVQLSAARVVPLAQAVTSCRRQRRIFCERSIAGRGKSGRLVSRPVMCARVTPSSVARSPVSRRSVS